QTGHLYINRTTSRPLKKGRMFPKSALRALCASYRNFHFLCLICKQLSPLLRRSGQRGGAVVQPWHRDHPIPPHSVDVDAYSTLPGLEGLSADLCRSLGGVSARPSALSDPLL